MSLTKTQIDALIDRNCKTNSTSYPVADKTADENLAIDEVFSSIFEAGGTWQFDDSNHTDYPIITTDLVSGQRDYSFTTDQQGNLILDIYKVFVKNEAGVYVEVEPVDVQSNLNGDMAGFYDGRNTTGTVFRYDKTANGIFLDKIPSYNSTAGLKLYINREASYFTSSDTTKKPGFAGLFHEYIALAPSYRYAYRNGLANKNDLLGEKDKMMQAIRNYYGNRERDIKRRMRPSNESTR